MSAAGLTDDGDVVIPEVLAPRIVHGEFFVVVNGARRINGARETIATSGTIGWYDGAPPWAALKALADTMRVRFSEIERVDEIRMTLRRKP